MRYLVLGETKNKSDIFLDNILKEMPIYENAYIAKTANEYIVNFENGNSYKSISPSVNNLRGRRADVVIYDDLCDIRGYYTENLAKEWISWEDYIDSKNNNKYIVELL